SWTVLGGSHAPPNSPADGGFIQAGNPEEGGADRLAAVDIPEYGVIMILNGTTTGADTWLYKHDGNPGGPIDTTPPTVPTGLTAVAISSGQINLSWNPSSDDVGVAGYNVYRDGVQIPGTFGTTFQDTGLTSATPHSYTVAAYDAA